MRQGRPVPARTGRPRSLVATPSSSAVTSRACVTVTSPGPSLVTRTCTTRNAQSERACRIPTDSPASVSDGIGVGVGEGDDDGVPLQPASVSIATTPAANARRLIP